MTEHVRASSEGIYRRVTMRTYGDERFMRLTPLRPSGQALWLYLLTGPHTGPIPGVFVAGRAALAETLGWSQKDFDEAFAEVLREGLTEFDPKSRLCFIPNAIRHNSPQNPNVVKSWRAHWLLLPECPMRARIYTHIFEALSEVSEAFRKAFEETCGKALGKPFGKALSNDSDNHPPKQEQEQEQERKQEQENRPTVFCERDSKEKHASHAQAPSEKSKTMTAKERVWSLGPEIVGGAETGARTFLGKLVAAHGEEIVDAALSKCAIEQPGLPRPWLLKACEAMAKARGAVQRNGMDLAGDDKPTWAIKAGFANRFEAVNEGCFQHNAAEFSKGKRAEVTT